MRELTQVSYTESETREMETSKLDKVIQKLNRKVVAEIEAHDSTKQSLAQM